MEKLSLKFGRGEIQIDIPKNTLVTLLKPPSLSSHPDPKSLVSDSLAKPLIDANCDLDFTNKQIAIAINDKTRPVPHDILLSGLLEYLEKKGAKSKDISFIIATGTHAPMTSDEFPLILPRDIINKYRIQCHDCDDPGHMHYLGATTMGTKVFVNDRYFQAEVKIVVGNIEPHHFMGFSGGVKSAAIGLTARETITMNHRHLVEPDACAGNYSTNPCRIDVEEIGRMIGVDFALNAILSIDKQIIHVLWGRPNLVFLKGAQMSADMTQIVVQKEYDLVIASAGGYPKDINLYQAQKALTHAAIICRDGGDVVLVAECEEGAGNPFFAQFLEKISTPEEAMAAFSKAGFSIGPHKAFQIARIASRVNIHLLSGMPNDIVNRLLFNPMSIDQLNAKIAGHPAISQIAVMPYAVVTIPQRIGE